MQLIEYDEITNYLLVFAHLQIKMPPEYSGGIFILFSFEFIFQIQELL